jgi:amidase
MASLVLAGCEPRPAVPAGETASAAPAVPAAVEVAELPIAELQQRMTAGELTSVQLTQAYLDRIAKLDDAGPTLNAVIEINPDALAIAMALDAERAAGKVRGALHGIPVLLKDNIDTADKMRTSAGSLALAEHRATTDAHVVQQLRAAGAVILGKTNLSEWANFRSDLSSSGWSSRGGQTKNPYVLDRNPCGSSSGTGAAIAASFAAAGLGTETDGSIVCPSSANGLVGIKPTVGLVSRTGIIPIAESQDTAGPMARTVADAAVLLAAMRGIDAGDPASQRSVPHLTDDYLAALKPDALRGKRIGVLRKHFGFHPEVDRVMNQAIDKLREQGAEIVDPVELATHGKFGEAEFTVLLYEFKHGLNAYLARTGDDVTPKSLTDLIAFNERETVRVMPWFGQELLVQANAKGGLDSLEYTRARDLARRLAGPQGIDATLAKHRLDALVAPTGGPAWVTDLVNGDHFGGGSSSAAAVAGYPAITVPAGSVRGLPVGITFVGPAWSEAKLIGFAHAFERVTAARVAPEFKATLSQ